MNEPISPTDYAYDMKRLKLGDAMLDENDMFENVFAAINVCPKLVGAMFYEDDFLTSQVLICKFIMMIACLLFTMIILMKVGLQECQLGSIDPTILEDVESYFDNYESEFGEVMTLFSNDSTILEEVSIYYDENKVATYDDYCDDTYDIKSRDDYILLNVLLPLL